MNNKKDEQSHFSVDGTETTNNEPAEELYELKGEKPLAIFQYQKGKRRVAALYGFIFLGILIIFILPALIESVKADLFNYTKFMGLLAVLVVTVSLCFSLGHILARKIVFFRDCVLESTAFFGEKIVYYDTAHTGFSISYTMFSTIASFRFVDKKSNTRIVINTYLFSKEDNEKFFDLLSNLSGRPKNELTYNGSIPFRSKSGVPLKINWAKKYRREWLIISIIITSLLLFFWYDGATSGFLLYACTYFIIVSVLIYLIQKREQKKFESAQREFKR